MSDLILYAIPVFLLMMTVEVVWSRRHPRAIGYERRDTSASLAMGLGSVVISTATALITIPAFSWLYQHRILDLGGWWWSWFILLLAEDFCYYWFHRSHHEVRLLWAAHVVHHSSQHYNLSTALRQPWGTAVTGPMFWAPLPLLGFSPAMVFTAQALSLIYQFGLHTEAIDRLGARSGAVEWLLNTPSHHRVHHGTNPQYLDKNHGGIFIFWDRLFGTFALETEPATYGITSQLATFHPLRIAGHELAAIREDLRRVRGWRAAVQAVIGRPAAPRPLLPG
jgi:sterol desaturase/sphingolipid hydroxylase (fatty acid hydroxylase superfamily)